MAQGRLSTEDLVLRPGASQDDEPDTSATEAPEPRDLPLLDAAESDGFLQRWSEVQARFVDDPQGAVRDGDSLVAELMQALASSFAQHKEGLEQQWSSGGEPGTEELRLALQQYRSFFQRLLAT
jgi:hypothetical protein